MLLKKSFNGSKMIEVRNITNLFAGGKENYEIYL